MRQSGSAPSSACLGCDPPRHGERDHARHGGGALRTVRSGRGPARVITGPVQSVKLARKLRSEMTLPETMLWNVLRTRPEGFKFRRQHAAGHYILDFFWASIRPAIEVDGAAHDGAKAAMRDARRSESLRSQHGATIRIPARTILNDVGSVVMRIVKVCCERRMRIASMRSVPLHQPAAGPPPRAGEDRL